MSAEPGLARQGEVAGEQAPEIGQREARGVDHEIRPVARPGEALALEPDAVAHRAVVGHRVAAPRLGEAPAQRLVVAVEEEQRDVEVVAFEQRRDIALEMLDVEGARPDVGAERERTSGPAMRVLDETPRPDKAVRAA